MNHFYNEPIVIKILRVFLILCIGVFISHCPPALSQSTAEWTEISANVPDVLPDGDFLDADFIGNEGWIVFGEVYNNYGIILHTEDDGQSFNLQLVPQIPNVIEMITEEIGFVGCLSGNVYYTTNGGEEWEYVSGILGSEIYGIAAINDPLVGYACGQDGWIAKFDTNQFLSLQQPFGSWIEHPDLFDLSLPSDTNEAWVCGENIIGHFSNGTWDSLSSPYCNNYYALSFIDNQTGWCTGGQGTFMTPVIANTADGIIWQQQQHPLIDQWLYDIFFIDQEVGWSVGMYIVATQDGGETWIKEAENFGNIWYAVSAVNESAVYVVGRNKRILKKDLISSIPERASARVLPAFPNPFTTTTTIEYELEKISSIQFTIYSVQGVVIFDTKEHLMQAGNHKVSWSPGPNIPAGLYYAVLRSENGVRVVKMVKQ